MHLIRQMLRVFIVVATILTCSPLLFGQTACVTADEVKQMVAQLSSPNVSLNKKLKEELLKLKKTGQKDIQEAVAEDQKNDNLMKDIRKARDKNTAALCPLLKKFGWPTTELVGADGVAAAFYLLKNSSSFELQRNLLPVIIAAVNKGQLKKSDFARFIDQLRLHAGLKQLFGSEVTIQDGFLVLYPIEAEAQVDARRKQYDLPPLATYLRALENVYHLPLVRSNGALTNSFADNAKASIKTATSLLAGQAAEEDEVIRVDTNLVSLNVSVFSTKVRTQVSQLAQKEFTVSEDGHEETVTFFASTEVPFDLVLLLDLSGSTADKRDLIVESTRRFIEAARPSDRIAIVTFWNVTNVIAPLTSDRAKLLESLSQITGGGGSAVWDALKFTVDQVLGPRTRDRRRAVVFMTDGIDNALSFRPGFGSQISFADLLETVRRSDILVIPIYLDTEPPGANRRGMFASARQTLTKLADESGGLFYRARKIEDLKGVYTQVIEDLGTVYSLGYKSTNEKRDGSWRSVKITVPGRPDLMTRARPGYYAN
jgi:VWFA-related protein